MIVAAVAALVLLGGWVLGIDRLRFVVPGLRSMVPTTAVCFILLSTAVVMRAREVPHAATFARILAVVVGAIAATNLVLVGGGWGPGIDVRALPWWGDRLAGQSMAVATAVDFLLAAACTLVLTRRSVPLHAVIAASSVGLALPLIDLLGYALDSTVMLGVFMFAPMAIHTALLMSLLFVALLLQVQKGWLWVFLGDGVGSEGARRLVPVVVLGPVLLCLLAHFATRQGFLTADFRLTLLGAAMVLIGLAAVVRNAQLENRSQRRLMATLDELREAVADKNLLIREIHHRVKNNLQQITALLAIEASKYRDPAKRAPFEALGGRVQALGIVHQLLMQSPRQAEIGVGGFLHDLCDSIRRSHYLIKQGITLSVEAHEEEVHLDAAVSLGLLVNELVVNAVKHAFAERENGTVIVRYLVSPENPDDRVIEVADDGRGIDLAHAIEDHEGGQRIIRSLVAQLRGTMAVDTAAGTAVSVIFPARIFFENRYVE